MVIVNSYSIAIVMCIVTMLCWGSWANTQKLTGQRWWPFQLFYWDYAIGVMLMTLLLAVSMGTIGEQGRNFFSDLSQAGGKNISLAFLSGVIFNVANILLVAAIDISGMAVAFPVAIGLALVIGVVANYIATPIGAPLWLFLGVGLVTLAIILDGIAYRYSSDLTTRAGSKKGIIIAVISGILMGYFYRFLAASMSFNFAFPEMGKITPYTAAFIFSIGLFVSNFICNSLVMRWPFTGERVYYRDYFRKGDKKLHLTGVLGGAIWSIGLVFNLVAAGAAGYAISYGLGQGATLIAALWGVFVWKELSACRIKGVVALMFILYVIGLLAIILSR